MDGRVTGRVRSSCALSVQGDKEPASSHPLHRAGPQPLQVSGSRLPQVLQEGQSAALPHQVLPLGPAAGPRPGSGTTEVSPDPPAGPERPAGLLFNQLDVLQEEEVVF